MKLNRKITNVQVLTEAQKDQMFLLMEAYYGNSKRNDFDRDLKEKNWVLLLTEEDSGNIAGFSTQMLIPFQQNGQEVLVLFSGDTIISKEHWGSMALSLCFGELMLKLLDEYPDSLLYWMLISKGLRTYKYLPTFFIDYYPCYDKETPKFILELMRYLGEMKYPGAYDESRGIIEAKSDGQFLKQEFQPEANPKKPHEVFFYKANPGYNKGDELFCLAQLSMDNINPFIKRILKSI